MTTETQIITNRRNTLKSTGPRTPKGKAAVSQNAVKHGLSARSAVISSESQADFDLYHGIYARRAHCQPLLAAKTSL